MKTAREKELTKSPFPYRNNVVEGRRRVKGGYEVHVRRNNGRNKSPKKLG